MTTETVRSPMSPAWLGFGGSALAVVSLALPWMATSGVPASDRSGASLVGGLVAVALVVAGTFTAFARKRTEVEDPIAPKRLGLIICSAGLVALIVRAVAAPGPSAAADFIDRRWGLLVALAASAPAVAATALEVRTSASSTPPPWRTE